MSPRWSSHPEFFISKTELTKSAFFSSKPVVRMEGECECESAACLGRWKRVLWGGVVRPIHVLVYRGGLRETQWETETGSHLSHGAFCWPSPKHMNQSTSLPPLLPSYLKIASSVTEGSGPFVGILLLLLIPFKPFPTQFPEQLLFCLKPSSGFPSHWEENIYSRPQSHVQSNHRLSLWLDLLYVAHCTPASRAILLFFKKAKFIPRSIDLL